MSTKAKKLLVGHYEGHFYAAADKKSKHDPLGEEGMRYLNPPSPGVYYLMVEFDMTRSMAEWIADIT